MQTAIRLKYPLETRTRLLIGSSVDCSLPLKVPKVLFILQNWDGLGP